MDAHHLFVGNRLDPQRIRFAQIGLFREGKLLEVLLGLDIGHINALELTGVERRPLFQSVQLLFEKIELFGGELHSESFRLANAKPRSFQPLRKKRGAAKPAKQPC